MNKSTQDGVCLYCNLALCDITHRSDPPLHTFTWPHSGVPFTACLLLLVPSYLWIIHVGLETQRIKAACIDFRCGGSCLHLSHVSTKRTGGLSTSVNLALRLFCAKNSTLNYINNKVPARTSHFCLFFIICRLFFPHNWFYSYFLMLQHAAHSTSKWDE